eukprot:Em0020g243a
MWRLVTVSSTSKQQNTQVLWTELGAATFTIWKFILNEPPPLSPPSFSHISLAGMTHHARSTTFRTTSGM